MKTIGVAAGLLSFVAARATAIAVAQDPPSCQEVTAHPEKYLQTKVTLIGLLHATTTATADGRNVTVFVFVCSDQLGHQLDYTSFFAFEGKAAKKDPGADNSVAQKISGVVHAALEVPLANGRYQVKPVMPYLTEVEVRAP
jgi:hypothetical protein